MYDNYSTEQINALMRNKKDSVTSYETVMSVNYNSTSMWSKVLKVCGKYIEFKIDTGSQVNILPKKNYEELRPKPQISNTAVTLSAYNNTTVPAHGKCICFVEFDSKKIPGLFIITDDNILPILGLHTSEELRLIKLVNAITSSKEMVSKYADCFGDIGCLQNEYHMEVDPNISPVISPPRKIPHFNPTKIKSRNRMLKMNIIQQVSEHTEWVNAMIIVEKPNGTLRICLDPRPLNRAIKRHHYQLPTAEEIFSDIKQATVFSKLDASSGYWQIPVDNETSKLLTFSTPYGL